MEQRGKVLRLHHPHGTGRVINHHGNYHFTLITDYHRGQSTAAIGACRQHINLFSFTYNDMKNAAGFTFKLLAAQVENRRSHHLIHGLQRFSDTHTEVTFLCLLSRPLIRGTK